MTAAAVGLEIIFVADAASWEAWLETHQELQTGVWLKIAKKASSVVSVTWSDAVDSALCYGWVDSLRHGLDQTFFLQKFTPRRRRSAWSKVNTRRVDALIATGRMRSSGLAEVAAARADGRWDAAYGKS